MANLSTKIVDQRVVKKKSGDYSLVLTLDSGGDVKEQWLGFDRESADKTFAILKHLGFQDLDFSRLDAVSGDFFDLRGKVLNLFSSEKNGKTYWNVSLPRALDLKDVKAYIQQNRETLEHAASGGSGFDKF